MRINKCSLASYYVIKAQFNEGSSLKYIRTFTITNYQWEQHVVWFIHFGVFYQIIDYHCSTFIAIVSYMERQARAALSLRPYER